jgi:hypothetical protein
MSDAADRLFAHGRPLRSVNERLEDMADGARHALEYLKNAESQKIRRMGRKQIGQWAARQVGCCVRTYQRTPPEDLVDLILFLLDAEGPPKSIQPKGWRLVAHHKAIYPKKSTRHLAELAGISHTQVATWLKEPAFQREVANVRKSIELNGFDAVKNFLVL